MKATGVCSGQDGSESGLDSDTSNKPLRTHNEPTSTVRFLSSLTSTVAAVTVSSPFDVLKTRVQVQKDKMGGAKTYDSVSGSFMKIMKDEGVKGFF